MQVILPYAYQGRIRHAGDDLVSPLSGVTGTTRPTPAQRRRTPPHSSDRASGPIGVAVAPSRPHLPRALRTAGLAVPDLGAGPRRSSSRHLGGRPGRPRATSMCLVGPWRSGVDHDQSGLPVRRVRAVADGPRPSILRVHDQQIHRERAVQSRRGITQPLAQLVRPDVILLRPVPETPVDEPSKPRADAAACSRVSYRGRPRDAAKYSASTSAGVMAPLRPWLSSRSTSATPVRVSMCSARARSSSPRRTDLRTTTPTATASLRRCPRSSVAPPRRRSGPAAAAAPRAAG